jgi:hypothetical protein
MPVADFAQNVQTPFFPMVRHTMDWKPGKSATAVASTAKPADAGAAATKTASTDSSDGKSFWQDVLDVVNPLQHLPIVGTVYRAITGDKIGDVEKVAGDTLYGGPLGLVSSLADVAFEKITGKDFGSTVMSMLDIGADDKATAVAAAAMKPLPPRTTQSATVAQTATATAAPALLAAKTDPAAKLPTPQIPTLTDANAQALMAAMNQNGVDSDLGQRALFAYQKSLGLSADANGASPAP